LQEKTLEIGHFNPIDLYGPQNSNLKIIRGFFPKLKIITRGNLVKVAGEPSEVEQFEKKFNLFIQHLEKYNELREVDIERLMVENGKDLDKPNDILVHGNSGLKVRARTVNQRRMVEESDKNDMLFAIGPAGTGKTYTAVALAVRALKNKEVRRIILTRPAVEAGENLGFLPGDLKEKLDPYLQPLYDALRDMLPEAKLQDYIENGIIQIAPLAFMRGRTLDKAFVILDEAQNATVGQLKMFLTRMGKSAKFVITGDESQVDLPRHQKSGLTIARKLFMKVDGIAVVELGEADVIRHKLVKKVIAAFDKMEKEQSDKKAEKDK